MMHYPLPLSLETILKVSGGELANGDAFQGNASVSRIATLGQAVAGDLAFFFSKEYQNEIVTSRPSVLITAPPFVGPLKASGLPLWKSTAIVACADPYLAMAELSRFFAGADANEASGIKRAKSEIHPTAVVAKSARLGERVLIGPYVVIGENVVVGDDSTFLAHTTLGDGVKIGHRTKFFAGVHVYPGVTIGSDVRVHSDTVIGSDGFGYAAKREGGKVVGQVKIYHLGTVEIADEVEIGASVTIDRATFGATKIGKGAKLDNKVHIGHNCVVGEGAILCGALALAGGVEIGRFAYVGGLTGITNRVKIGDGAMVGALSLVSKDVPAGDSVVGNPARPSREHFKVHAMLNRMLDKKPSNQKD